MACVPLAEAPAWLPHLSLVHRLLEQLARSAAGVEAFMLDKPYHVMQNPIPHILKSSNKIRP
jgi:hypothetical protein